MASAGPIKSFNPSKGFGFIEVDGIDIFVHINSCTGGIPKVGDFVNFDAEESPSKPGTYVAKNVTGGTGGPAKTKPGEMGNGEFRAKVKTFVPGKGFGFIDHNGTDVFVHIRDCENGMPQQGDMVAFNMKENPDKPGTFKAFNVTGGTLPLENAFHGTNTYNSEKGKGKGKDMWGGGKGKDMWGYGPSWDAWGWSDPWSKGWDAKGWGKGWEKGWDSGKGGPYGKGKGW